MRITLLDTAGWVIYDNFSHIDSITDNHSGRPEILESLKNGTGHSLRYSSTLDAEYLYFSKKYQDGFVRTALDYKQSVYPSLKGNRNWQAYIAIVFALSIVILVYITRKLSQPYYSLKQFVERVRHNEEHYDDIRFPKDELGEVGEQIMTAFREMDNAKKYKQQLTHNIAHELKTPVTGIRGYLETLLQEDNIDKEQARFFLERAYSQSLRLSAIVNDISVLNKIEEGPDQFEFETINISKCLQEIRNDLSFKLEEKNISFFMQIDPNLAIQGNYLLIYSLFKYGAKWGYGTSGLPHLLRHRQRCPRPSYPQDFRKVLQGRERTQQKERRQWAGFVNCKECSNTSQREDIRIQPLIRWFTV
jgi:signal transduction histidine kinase